MILFYRMGPKLPFVKSKASQRKSLDSFFVLSLFYSEYEIGCISRSVSPASVQNECWFDLCTKANDVDGLFIY